MFAISNGAGNGFICKSRAKRFSKVMRAQGQKQDERDWHADEPQQHRTHRTFLSSVSCAAKSTQRSIVPPAL